MKMSNLQIKSVLNELLGIRSTLESTITYMYFNNGGIYDDVILKDLNSIRMRVNSLENRICDYE